MGKVTETYGSTDQWRVSNGLLQFGAEECVTVKSTGETTWCALDNVADDQGNHLNSTSVAHIEECEAFCEEHNCKSFKWSPTFAPTCSVYDKSQNADAPVHAFYDYLTYYKCPLWKPSAATCTDDKFELVSCKLLTFDFADE